MTYATAIDITLPTLVASLLAICWALLVYLPTYQIAKRIKAKWFASLAGTVATIVVIVGGMSLGAFSSLVYLAAFKNVDINAPREPTGSIEVIFDPMIWAILVPIITPLLVLIPVFSRWEKVGARIGVYWA